MTGCTQGNVGQYLNGHIPLNTDAVTFFACREALDVPVGCFRAVKKYISPDIDSKNSWGYYITTPTPNR
ncbi:hypothetical protein [uncultured Thiodictyon sp.]|uniref:hypothetical protein n=1 Tax=uncultured Thiodictyon sp. TaxID=1846217 RepID=UPI0025E68FB9|nr:hypothetical protein [uncultured Thiodictyon sp.]